MNVRATAIALVVLAGAACGGSHVGAPVGHAPPTAGYRLAPAGRRVVGVCRRLQAARAMPVLCPMLLPRPSAGRLPTFVTTYGAPSSFYAIVVIYGAPADDHRTASPSRFLHLEILGGYWSGRNRACDLCDSFNPGGLAGAHRLERPLAWLTLAGHHGRLFSGLPHAQGGGEFGDHLSFLWHAHGLWYLASLHSWTPRTQALTVLRTVVSHLATPDGR